MTSASSLRAKVALGILLPMVLTLAILAYLEYQSQRRLMLANLDLDAANTSRVIAGSLQHAMQTNDFSSLQQILTDIAAQPDLRELYLLDKQGHTIMAGDPEAVKGGMAPLGITCQTCHQTDVASRNESLTLTDAQGRRFVRNVHAIANEPSCQECHDPQDSVLAVLITDFGMARINAHLLTLGRSRLLWALGSTLAALFITYVMVDRVIIHRLRSLLGTIQDISQGNLTSRARPGSADELGVVARAMNQMADGLQEKQKLEHELAERTVILETQAEELATLNALAITVGQSLNLREILSIALEEVLELTKMTAGWVYLWDKQRTAPELAASRGLERGVDLGRALSSWDGSVCRDVLASGQTRLLLHPPDEPCPISQAIGGQGLCIRACIPLLARERVLGIMGLAATEDDPATAVGTHTGALLTAVGRQIGIAVENARLYEALRREQALQRQLLDRAMTAQEEERKHIARELHDQTGQALSSLVMTLEVLGQCESSPEAAKHLTTVRELGVQILEQVHDLALELRPSVLDDLGLIPAIRHYLREYQSRFHIPVEFQAVGFDQHRLATEAETALYRIMQEALTNVVKHANADSVSVLLEYRGDSVVLIIEDDGQGFDVPTVLGDHLERENLGLYGMQERASLLHGKLTIESSPDTGTAVYVEVPVDSGREYEQNSPAGRG